MTSQFEIRQRRLALAGPAAAACFAGSLVVFARLRTDGYTHGTKAVSELGALGAPNAGLFNALAFVAPGVLVAILALILMRRLDSRVGPALLALSGLCFACVGIFPFDMDRPDALTSVLHYVFVMGSGLAWGLSLFSLGPKLTALAGLGRWGRATPWFALFLLAHVGWQVVFRATGLGLPGYGQRVAFAGYFLWIAVTGWLLATHKRGENS